MFSGKVQDFNPITKWFNIRYTDGDQEEVELRYLKKIIKALPASFLLCL